jgi:hypothetical protein
MSDVQVLVVASIGVLVAVIFPVLRGFIRNEFRPLAGEGLPPWLRKYGGLFLFSAITGVIVLAIFRAANPDTSVEWYTAFLLGFGWESAIEKFSG